jgi:hypothetical protein
VEVLARYYRVKLSAFATYSHDEHGVAITSIDQLSTTEPLSSNNMRPSGLRRSARGSEERQTRHLELVTRGFDKSSWSDWRVVMRYQFVGPAARVVFTPITLRGRAEPMLSS